MGTTVDERRALKELKQAKERRRGATLAYHNAVKKCVDLGISNVAMARELGVSETAIRLYRKRKFL